MAKVNKSERVPLDIHEDVLVERAKTAAQNQFRSAGATLPELGDDPAFNEVYRAARGLRSGLKELYERLDQVDRDDTRTSSDKTRLKGQIRDRHAGAPAKRVDAARRRAQAEIGEIDRRTEAALRDTMSTAEGKEVRDYVRSLDSPVSFLLNATQTGDNATLAAVLSHRPYLSGLTAEQQQTLKQAYQAKQHPEDTARRAMLTAALERLEANSERYIVEQAQMVNSHESARLERERQATDDAVSRPLNNPDDDAEPQDAGQGAGDGGAGDDGHGDDDNGHGDDDNADAA